MQAPRRAYAGGERGRPSTLYPLLFYTFNNLIDLTPPPDLSNAPVPAEPPHNIQATTDINIRTDRLRIIKLAMTLLYERNQEGTPRQIKQLILKEMNLNIPDGTIRRDIKAIEGQNSFVRDLTESRYSGMIERVYKTARYVENEARRMYAKDWTADKSTTRMTKDGEFIETVKTEPLARPKEGFLKVMLKAAELQEHVLSGDVLNVSAAMLNQTLLEYEKQNRDLRAEIDRLKKTPCHKRTTTRGAYMTHANNHVQ